MVTAARRVKFLWYDDLASMVKKVVICNTSQMSISSETAFFQKEFELEFSMPLLLSRKGFELEFLMPDRG